MTTSKSPSDNYLEEDPYKILAELQRLMPKTVTFGENILNVLLAVSICMGKQNQATNVLLKKYMTDAKLL